MTPYIVGCVGCDDRKPEERGVRMRAQRKGPPRAVRAERGLVWHFDDYADFELCWRQHAGHLGAWSFNPRPVEVTTFDSYIINRALTKVYGDGALPDPGDVVGIVPAPEKSRNNES